MREWISYLGEIILITAVSGMIYTLAPEGSLKKHLHFVISLCVLVSLAVPMFSMVTSLPELFERSISDVKNEAPEVEGELEEQMIGMSKKELETSISVYISEKYGIERADISVSTVLDAKDPQAIEITSIDVSIRGITAAKARTIRTALTELFLGKSTVSVTAAEE